MVRNQCRPLHFICTSAGFLEDGESVCTHGGASGLLSLLTAENLPEETARQLLQDLINLYPLDALGDV